MPRQIEMQVHAAFCSRVLRRFHASGIIHQFTTQAEKHLAIERCDELWFECTIECRCARVTYHTVWLDLFTIFAWRRDLCGLCNIQSEAQRPEYEIQAFFVSFRNWLLRSGFLGDFASNLQTCAKACSNHSHSAKESNTLRNPSADDASKRWRRSSAHATKDSKSN